MEIRWLDDFIALAKTRNFSRAADMRNVTQPTLSRRIKLLEDEMKVTLIDRNSLPLSLTAAGELFLASAEQISRIHNDTKNRCCAILEEQKNRVRFASTQSLYIGLWKSWLEPLASELGVDIDQNLQSTTWMGADFVNALTSGECDMVLCYWHPAIEFIAELESGEYEYLELCDEHLVPVTALDEQGQPKYQLPGSKGAPLPYIGYHSSSFMQPVIQSFLKQRVKLPHLVTMNENVHSISAKAMIKEEFGFGWIPGRLLKDNFRYQSLGRAGGLEWDIPMQIRLYRLRNNSNTYLQKFWSGLEMHLKQAGSSEVSMSREI